MRRSDLRARNADGAKLWPPPRQGWVATAGVAVIFAGHWLYGALVNDVALLMGLAAAVLLAIALALPALRDDLLRLRGLGAPALCFGLVIAVGLWTLTPWTPGGPHPVWTYVGQGPGASTVDRSSTVMELIKLLCLACFFGVGALAGARDDRARYALRLLVLAGLAFSLWAFIRGATAALAHGNRIEGNFGNANTAGTLFAALFALALAEATRRAPAGRKKPDAAPQILAGSIALAFLICLLGSASRGAAVAALGALAVFVGAQVALGRLKPSRLVWAGLAAAVSLLTVLGAAGDLLLRRTLEAPEDTVLRTAVWDIHWQAFLDSPLFGYGLGTPSTVNATLVSASTFDRLWNIRGLLNVYLQWLEQAGLVGAVPMFLCIGAIIVLTVRGALRRSRMTAALAALLAVDAVFLIHGFTDFGLEVFSMAAMWSWLLGLQFALAQGSSRR